MPNPVDITTLEANYATISPGGPHNIEPGKTLDIDDATFTCLAGGLACEITVADDGTVTSAGGMATAKNSTAANNSKMAIALTANPDGTLRSNAGTGNPTVAVERGPNGVTTIKLTPDADDDGKYSTGTVTSHVITGWTGLTLKRNNAIAETETDRAESATSMDEATLYTNIQSAKSGKLKYKEVLAA